MSVRSITGIVGVALLLGSACNSAEPMARLSEYDPGSGGVVSVDQTEPDRPYSFDDITLCLEQEGSVVVTDVVPIEPTGGMQVVGFAVLPAREGSPINYVERNSQRLIDAGFPAEGPMVVDSVCPSDDPSAGRLYLLGIEVMRSDAEAGTVRGFRVTYESGGESATAEYPLGLALCSNLWLDREAGLFTPECEVEHIEM